MVLCKLCGGSVAFPRSIASRVKGDVCPALIEGCASFDLPGLPSWSLQGHSRAGERTGFWLSPLQVALDAGMVTNRTPVAVFITHSHVDHSWQLPWILGCRTPMLKGFEHLCGRPVFAPVSAWPMLTQLEQVCHNLSVGSMEDNDWTKERILAEQRVVAMPVQAGQRLEVPGVKNMEVQILPCYHPAETVAFGFSELRMKLKAEYTGLSKKEVADLRKSGATIMKSQVLPRLVFFGDTHIGALLDHVEWKAYPVVIVECTIYPDIIDEETKVTYSGVQKSPDVARAIGHIDWNSILPIIKSHPDNFFVLIHSSQAIRAEALRALERDTKKQGVVNFKIWHEP